MTTDTELTVIETTATPIESGPLLDLRSRLMTLPVPQMDRVLKEYDDRQAAFRKWIYSHLVRGLHYGFPPGTEPKFDKQGNVLNNRGGIVSPDQWRPRESMYKAGADRLCELLAARDEYQADLDAWKQLGEPAGTFVFSCRLYCRVTGTLLGEGRGVRAVGDKKGDANSAIKMSKKAAKVDAVLNTWGLSDLFTQDLEDLAQPQPDQHANPPKNEKAPVTATRDQRATFDQMKALTHRWQEERKQNEMDVGNEAWEHFAATVAKLPAEKSRQLSAWTRDMIASATRAIEEGILE